MRSVGRSSAQDIAEMSALNRVLKRFLETTTLHGYKYLTTSHYLDLTIWIAGSLVSMVCAAVLCAVTWNRFLGSPAVMAVGDLTTAQSRTTFDLMPSVYVCSSTQAIAQGLADSLSLKQNETVNLQTVLRRVLRGRPAQEQHLQDLEHLLDANNLTLTQAVKRFTPPCQDMLLKCQWYNVWIPCQKIFKMAITSWGMCCTMTSYGLTYATVAPDPLQVNYRLNLVLRCSNEHVSYGCEYFTKYRGEDYNEPTQLMSGHIYYAHVTHTTISDSNKAKVVDANCVTWRKYSRTKCLVECIEAICKCRNPFRIVWPFEINTVAPPCPPSRLNCITDSRAQLYKCNCPLACRRAVSDTFLESMPLRIGHTFDPIYEDLNVSSSVVLQIRVNIDASKTYDNLPTETWLTLLSSLGGVFNMFLGIGLFSLLELLFLLLVKLPNAIKRAPEMEQQSPL